MQYNVPTAG